MRRGWKIAIAALAGLAVLVAVNAAVTGAETKPAEATVEDGRLMRLGGEELQYVDRGPRNGRPIVLLHGFSAAIDWWDRIMPLLDRRRRVVAVDLLGHGGSSKPSSGYSMPEQAALVAQLLARLGVEDATVVGHSMGGTVAVALTEQSPRLVDRLVLIDTASNLRDDADLGLTANLLFTPVLGEALWRIKPDFSVRSGLQVAFAPGFDVPDAFVEDVKRLTYSAYDESSALSADYRDESSLAGRAAETRKPLLAIMGAEEQLIEDPRAALRAYAEAVPGARTRLIEGAGHSPNVEKPDRTAALLLAFAVAGMQERLQKREGVRRRP